MPKRNVGSPPGGDVDLPVGVALARLRREAGITGQELGRQIGMSQAKISKIETGAFNPTREDVELFARAVGAPANEVERLARQAKEHRDSVMGWRMVRHDPAEWQRDIAEMEADAHELRMFSSTVMSGLLQTREVAKSVLQTVQDAWIDLPGKPAGGVTDAVAARVDRQKILDDRSKRFQFVLPEMALRTLLSEPEYVPGQMLRLRDIARQDNVTLSIVPDGTKWPYPPYHGFSLLDNRYVIVDLYNTIMVSQVAADLRLYRHVFDKLASSATVDVEPILQRYRTQ